MEEAGVSRVLGPYTVHGTQTAAGAYAIGQPGDTVVDDPSDVAGALTITVTQAITGTDPDAPVSGAFRIDAEDGSILRVSVLNGQVTLAVDSDGDGVAEDTLHTTWIDLN